MKIRRAICGPLAALVGALLLLTTLGITAATATPSSRPKRQATGTITNYVRPVDAQGRLKSGYRIVNILNGADCSQESPYSGDTRRCFAGNDIVDPCWPAAGSVPHVLCQFPPWGQTVWRLNLSTPLGTATPFASAPAWGIELKSGNLCGFAEGATDVIGGERVNYACERNNVWLVGWTIRTHNPWRIQTAVLHNGNFAVGPVQPIKTIWRVQAATFR
jgi:hypothetical protein